MSKEKLTELLADIIDSEVKKSKSKREFIKNQWNNIYSKLG